MNAFGVRFRVEDQNRFLQLQAVWRATKQDKEAEEFRDDAEWMSLVPDEVKLRFYWPSLEERQKWLAARDTTPIAISSPTEQVGSQWDFFSVIEAFENGEYTILTCECSAEGIGEMHIDPWSYPYGGVGPLIALAEAFGFEIVGVNEYGRFLKREDLFKRSR